MPRPRNVTPSIVLHVSLPGDIGARLNLHLYSEAEQRIPFAAYQRFLVDRVREFFGRQILPLSPYFAGSVPPDSYVYGSPEVIEMLRKALERK